MPLIALASVKGSPGVTTTCLALAVVWPGPSPRLLIEADPAGGDLGPRLGLAGPGLATLAAAARHDHGRGLAWQHARQLPGGLHLITAPSGAEQAAACLTALAGSQVLAALGAAPQLVIADCGRLDPGSPALPIAACAQLTVLMTHPSVSGLSHLALRTQALSAAGIRLALLLAPAPGHGGGAGYRAGEIAATLGIPVLACVPADPRGAAALASPGGGGLDRVRRLPLGRAAATLAAALARGPAQHTRAPDGAVSLTPAAAGDMTEVNAR